MYNGLFKINGERIFVHTQNIFSKKSKYWKIQKIGKNDYFITMLSP